jgi:hypothetical protein
LKETTRILQQNYRNSVLKELNTQQSLTLPHPRNCIESNPSPSSLINRITKKEIDIELLKLQVEKQCFVRQTANPQETAECVYKFTLAIAERPYK